MFLIFGFTPVVSWMMKGGVRSEALRRVPAVVVLAADSNEGVEMSDRTQARILRGYEVAQQVTR